MHEIAIPIEVRCRFAMVCARALFALRFVVGYRRAQRWAESAAFRLARYRVLGGKWQRIKER